MTVIDDTRTARQRLDEHDRRIATVPAEFEQIEADRKAAAAAGDIALVRALDRIADELRVEEEVLGKSRPALVKAMAAEAAGRTHRLELARAAALGGLLAGCRADVQLLLDAANRIAERRLGSSIEEQHMPWLFQLAAQTAEQAEAWLDVHIPEAEAHAASARRALGGSC